MGQSVDIDREACRTSVMLRSSAPEKYIFSAKDAVDLSCRVKEICVSDNLILGGDCKETLGEEYTNYKINKFDNNPEEKLKSLYAREMAECWNLMGRGEGQIFVGDFKSQNCVVCSIIALQDSVKEKVMDGLCYSTQVPGSVQDSSKCPNALYPYYKEKNPLVWDLNRYLYTHKVPGQEVSYAKYIYDSDTTTQDFLNYLNSKDETSFTSLENIKAIIFTQNIVKISSSAQSVQTGKSAGFWGACLVGFTEWGLKGFAGGASVGALPGGAVGGVTGGVVGCVAYGFVGKYVGSALGGAVFGTLNSGEDAKVDSAVLLVDYTPEALEQLGCNIESYS
jgi:hypothetical protein